MEKDKMTVASTEIQGYDIALGLLEGIAAGDQLDTPSWFSRRLFGTRPPQADFDGTLTKSVTDMRNAYDLMQIVLFAEQRPMNADELRSSMVTLQPSIGFEIVDAVVVAGVNDGVIQGEFRHDGNLAYTIAPPD